MKDTALKILTSISALTIRQALVIIAGACFFVYANTLINGMFWDDYDSIINNAYIRDWRYLPQYFSQNLTAGAGIADNYWRPLLLVSFSLDYKLGGLEPFFYHLQNLVWHLTASLLVFLLIARILKNNAGAALGALLFAVHPLQTEAVAYVAGRADPMHTTLMLASLLFFVAFLQSSKRALSVVSLFLFIASLLTKERAIVFPALLAIYIWALHARESKLRWKGYLALLWPYAFVAAAYIISRVTFLHFTDTFDPGAPDNLGITSLWIRILTYLKGIGIYAGSIVWPAKLYMEKSISLPTSIFDISVLAGVAMLTAGCAVLIYSARRKRIAAFGLLWVFITLAPSLHIFPIQGLLYEHWLYPALPGLFLLVGAATLPVFAKNKRPGVYVPALALILLAISALSIRAAARNQDWHDPIRFYEKNISLGGSSARVYTNLGMAYDEASRHEEAIVAYKKALELDSRLFQPWHNLGNTYMSVGKEVEALKAYLEAIATNPNFTPSYLSAASVYAQSSHQKEALELLKKAADFNPTDISLLYNLASISAEIGDKQQARGYFKKVLELDPGNTDIRIMLKNL